jgi:hypothetical protein
LKGLIEGPLWRVLLKGLIEGPLWRDLLKALYKGPHGSASTALKGGYGRALAEAAQGPSPCAAAATRRNVRHAPPPPLSPPPPAAVRGEAAGDGDPVSPSPAASIRLCAEWRRKAEWRRDAAWRRGYWAEAAWRRRYWARRRDAFDAVQRCLHPVRARVCLRALCLPGPTRRSTAWSDRTQQWRLHQVRLVRAPQGRTTSLPPSPPPPRGKAAPRGRGLSPWTRRRTQHWRLHPVRT